MLMETKDDLIKMLDYWYTIDFLGQSSMPYKQEPKQKPNDSENPETASFSFEIDCRSEDSLEAIRGKKLSEHGPEGLRRPENGSDYLFIGKIRREPVVERIAELIDAETKATSEKGGRGYREAETDSIAVALVAFDEKGNIEPRSLQLSPILWAVNKLKCSSSITSELLSVKDYRNDQNVIAEKMNDWFGGEPATPASLVAWAQRELAFLCDGLPPEEKGGLGYLQMDFAVYQNPKDKEYNQCLSRAYYAEDIQMARQAIISAPDSRLREGGLSALVRYIESAFDGFKPDAPRIDLLQEGEDGADSGNTRREILKAADPNNTPAGRWPSRFSLSLMQQIAVNLSTGEGTQDIMSVNGPPGTGKTTLLKDVIAANIVERALLLSEYEKADSAFESVEDFQKAHARKPNEHCHYYPSIYKFKNDRINDLGILVCSSNNAAVENISTELPNKADLLDGILKLSDSEKPSGDKPDEALLIERKLYSELDYFEKEATDLYSSGDDRSTECMLLSARLGKKENIKLFASRALQPIIQERMQKNQNVEDHEEPYENARSRFKEQYKIVKDMQEQLGEEESKYYSDLATLRSLDARIAESDGQLLQYREDQAACEKGIREAAEKAVKITASYYMDTDQFSSEKRIAEEATMLSDPADIFDALSDSWSQEKGVVEKLEGEIDSLTRNYEQAEAAYEKLSNRRFIRAAKKDAARSQRDEAKRNLDSKMAESTRRINLFRDRYQSFTAQRESFKAFGESLREYESRERESQGSKDSALKNYSQTKGAIDAFRTIDESGQYRVLGDDFFRALFSEGSGAERKYAHLSNVSSSYDLDRERDQLLHDALVLTREFVLSSKFLRSNLNNLYAMWGGSSQGEKDGNRTAIRFSDEARKIAMPVLMQSLFILTPVVSSTFASVGKMLADIEISADKEPALGLLIIDEAGQAVPHAAIGAIARCRRSLIVGDPNQVDPIVTSDLKLIRGAWREKIGETATSSFQSVQHFADRVNAYGSHAMGQESGSGDRTWMGCPLVIHRRCVSPIFDVSNEISYNSKMLNETRAQPMVGENGECRFCLPSSRWINVAGKERGDKNHYVTEQGDMALKLVKAAFVQSGGKTPKMYVISPFKLVARDFKKALKGAAEKWGGEGVRIEKEAVNSFCKNNVGTVHTFQGKEAAEVIFLLGCDSQSLGAVRWVTPNIVNVAASRAKQRLYVIGNIGVWEENEHIKKMKRILDMHWYDKYQELQELNACLVDMPDDEKRENAERLAQLTLEVSSFIPTNDVLREFGLEDFAFDDPDESAKSALARSYINNVADKVSGIRLGDALCSDFGFETSAALDGFLDDLQKKLDPNPEADMQCGGWGAKDIAFFIKDGILRYGALKQLVECAGEEDLDIQKDLAARDCLFRFACALELLLKLYFVAPIRRISPDFMSDGRHLTIGSISRDIRARRVFLGALTPEKDEEWWGNFARQVERFGKYRNIAAHVDLDQGRLGLTDCAVAIRWLFHVERDDPEGAFAGIEVPSLLRDVETQPDIVKKAYEEQKAYDLEKGALLFPKTIKDPTGLEEKVQSLESAREDALDEVKKNTLRWQVQCLKKGRQGEDETAYELEHSLMPIIIIRDLLVKADNNQGQIDLLVITPKRDVVIECKNYSADIFVDKDGGFCRRGRNDNRPIPFYSPITQNEHHIDSMQEHIDTTPNPPQFHPCSVVVFANKDASLQTDPNARIDGKVVRIDQVINAVKRIDPMCKGRNPISEPIKRDMRKRAAFWLSAHQGDRGETAQKWLEQNATAWIDNEERSGQGGSYASTRDGKESASAVSDTSYEGNFTKQPERIPLERTVIVQKSNKSFQTITMVVEGRPISASGANKILVDKGYLYVPDAKRLRGKQCNYGITNAGQEELGLVLREGPDYYCPVFPKEEKYDTKLKNIIRSEVEKASPPDI